MIKHDLVKLEVDTIKRYYVGYVLHQLEESNCDHEDCRKKLLEALTYVNLVSDFCNQLLEKVHPVTVMEKGFKN